MRSKVFLILLIILIGLAGLSFFIWQRNTYSKEVVKLEIIAPQEADVGEAIEYLIRIKNNGSVKLEDPQLIFELPSHSFAEENQGSKIIKTKKDFDGAIYPGEEKIFRIRAQLFGREGEAKEAKAILSYRPKNLTATYISTTSAVTIIKSIPLSFDFNLPSKIAAGKAFNFSINYFSSLDYPLNDVSIKVYYPVGFVFVESDPKGVANNEWTISVLNKAEGGKINIKGILHGEAGEERIFRAELGVWQDTDFVVLKTIEKRVEIIEPSLYIDQLINGEKEYHPKLGQLLHYEIIFRNIGDSPLLNLFLVVKLRGNAFDLSTIKVENAEHTPGDYTILWDGSHISQLQMLEPGEEGKVEFWVKLKGEDSKIVNPRIENEILIGQLKRIFSSKLQTELTVSQQAFIDDEIFGSEGPLPFEVNKESTLTIIWRVKNTSNLVKDLKIQAFLAPNVSLTGQMMPQELTFDNETRELFWDVGEIEPYQEKQLAFQVKVKPTSSQKGQFVPLISNLVAKGIDDWVQKEIEYRIGRFDTSGFGEELGKVQ